MADRERRPRLCTPEWTLLAYSQCAGGHHGAGFNWRRRCDDLLAVPRWDRAVGPELVSVWRGRPAAARCARALGWKLPSRAVETCPAMRRESHAFVITEPDPKMGPQLGARQHPAAVCAVGYGCLPHRLIGSCGVVWVRRPWFLTRKWDLSWARGSIRRRFVPS